MKIYPNDLCPCGSGIKYKKCCWYKSLSQQGMIGCLPVYKSDKHVDFIVNSRGAVVFKDESKQPVLEIPEGSTIKHVLLVGFSKTKHALVTVQDNDGAICYVLPNEYERWCRDCVAMSMQGMTIFPSDVEFSLINGKYSADIL